MFQMTYKANQIVSAKCERLFGVMDNVVSLVTLSYVTQTRLLWRDNIARASLNGEASKCILAVE